LITLGLDVGTTTISGVVYDNSLNQVLATRTLPNSAQVQTGKMWENLQDPYVIWDTCLTLLDGFRKDFPQLATIGLTGQMHGMVYVDSKGHAISALATWQDARGNQIFQNGRTYAEILSGLLEYPMATGYGLTTHFYNLKHRLVPDDAAAFCTIADYIGMRLCAREKPLMHASNAHSFGAFDLYRMHFDLEKISNAGIDAGMLPEVAQGEAMIGETADGIAVWAAIGDNQASFLGAAGDNFNIVANIGTSSQLSVRSKSLINVEGLDIRPHVKGEFILVGAGLCGGSAYALLRDLFQEVLEMYGVDARDTIYEKMEKAAITVLDSENPLTIDIRFRGTRIDAKPRGAITRIGMDNFSSGHLALGVMRGICDELFTFYQKVPESLRDTNGMVGGGNALRQNATLRTILAERLGMELILSAREEEAAAGASLVPTRGTV
jgi:sedoheptulokinase